MVEDLNVIQCPHCSTSIPYKPDQHFIGVLSEDDIGWVCRSMLCIVCGFAIVKIADVYGIYGNEYAIDNERLVFPSSAKRKPINEAVPEDMRNDYQEACEVLPVSAKASAALSRRILQHILQEQGYKGSNLYKQVNAVLNE